MLQEYPSQVQPKSSSTRHHNNIVDAEEAGNILITLSNQTSSHLKPLDSHKKNDNLNNSSKRIPYRERARSDPIMLLAAAAAAIDNSNVDDFSKGRRHYERREIIIQKRPPPSSSSNSMPYHRNSISSFDSYDSPQHYYSRNHHHQHHPPPSSSHPSTSTSDQNYALQYFSMKHNPKIKRNAMHAYITYMIYTDLAANDSSMKNKKRATGINDDILNKKKNSSIMDIDEEVEEEKVDEKKLTSFQSMPPSPPQHPYQQQQQQQLTSSTILPPPSSLSNHPHPSPPSYRSLTAYLWDSNNHSQSSNTLNGHSPRNKMVLPPLAPTRSYQ